jgi:hypothetical protein
MECNIYTFVFINYYAKIQNGVKENRHFIQSHVLKSVDPEVKVRE